MPDSTPADPVSVDAEGFLLSSDEWSFEVGEQLAHDAGLLALSPQHWRLIAACREEYARTGQWPDEARLLAVTRTGPNDLCRLFPGDSARLVARIAGLPRAR